MASLTTTSEAGRDEPEGARDDSLLAEIRLFWRLFIVQAFTPYRPELYYMRGPGPAWRAKHGHKPPPHG
ncbi:hypothetical protein BJ123_11626 [Rhodopseudomonas thermotolerans]|uniref:Uncharacterized protein n=2 Tax=Rhodopseudomonas TaxID=1073 RepID=A0A336K1E6_9BRAD|nr:MULTISPECIES: hypothetical protein [Rhodopseudomonas]RED30518.1 hypothetical protein BJ125_11626 [Rhodopseudomonas pentothenatexigens]REF92622.1 hypothetical protein BJ123_11626 [Rhodopseudomonas thermotolerans]SSW92051.1 hypothetical protein SAMN05892882_11626 [Rhodopseudomonas pentothenatexigens]